MWEGTNVSDGAMTKIGNLDPIVPIVDVSCGTKGSMSRNTYDIEQFNQWNDAIHISFHSQLLRSYGTLLLLVPLITFGHRQFGIELFSLFPLFPIFIFVSEK